MALTLRILSSLEKTMPGRDPAPFYASLTGMMNERISFQLAWKGDASALTLTAHAPEGLRIRLRRVLDVPVGLAAYPDRCDEDYLTLEPGCYPDLLRDTDGTGLAALPDRWQAVWVDVVPNERTLPGEYDIQLRMQDAQGHPLAQVTQHVCLLPCRLPPQRLVHTRWFHADCLADYYHAEPFSETHWRIVGNFLREAAEHGVNTTLMPIHTPPLDTAVGGERTTVQLVDVTLEYGVYRFGMDKVRRWIHLCLACGMSHFEMAHLYTQWGCAAAPKIMATVDGEYRRLFGWDTPALGNDYRRFLEAYIPALRLVFREEHVEDRVIWHISDEPNVDQLPAYLAAKAQVASLLQGCVIRDALSSFEFYRRGVVEQPIVATDHIAPFLEAGVPDLWAYYCCAQNRQVANQFIAMPSARSRILGVQLFKYRCTGFLQWGFNFYNCQLSRHPIDPYQVTDAEGAFPAGDPFLVYPGPDGQPEGSIRMMVVAQAMQDLRAFELLASLTSHEEAVSVIEECLDEPITFAEYPRDAAWLLRMRERVNRRIVQLIQS